MISTEEMLPVAQLVSVVWWKCLKSNYQLCSSIGCVQPITIIGEEEKRIDIYRDSNRVPIRHRCLPITRKITFRTLRHFVGNSRLRNYCFANLIFSTVWKMFIYVINYLAVDILNASGYFAYRLFVENCKIPLSVHLLVKNHSLTVNNFQREKRPWHNQNLVVVFYEHP